MSAVTAPSGENYVDFDEYVEFQLHKTQKSIKVHDLLTATAVAFALFIAGLLTFVVLDHWVFAGGFSLTARWCWFLAFAGAVLGWSAVRIVLPAFRRVNRLFAAKELEQADPALRSNLLNWVDLRDAGRPVHPAVMQTIEKQAATELSKMDVGQAIDHRPLLQASYALLAVVVLFCGYALLSPKKVSSSLWRIIPFTQAGAVTRTEIRDVTPGDTTLLARGQMEIGVTLGGEIPEAVQMIYSTADGRIQDEAIILRPEGEGLSRFRGIFAGENGSGVLQDFTYYIAAGDAKSRTYRAVVHRPPSATVNEVTYRHPEYMRFDDVTTPGGHIDGWEGATATITATADKPCRSATLQFLHDPQTPTGKEEAVEVTDGTQLRAAWTLGFGSDNIAPKHYRIICRNDSGEADPAPTVYNIAIKPDKSPEVVLLHPQNNLTAPANAVIPLLIEASDPDFELGYINLQAEIPTEKAGASRTHRESLSDGGRQRMTIEHDFALERLNVKPGDEIKFWIEAYDNKSPKRNRKSTVPLTIRIEDPVSKEKADEQLAESKKERAQRLEEAQQEGQEERQPPDNVGDEGDAKPGEREPKDPDAPPEPGDVDDAADAPQEKNVDAKPNDAGDPINRGGNDKSAKRNGGPPPDEGDAKPENAGEDSEQSPLSPNGEDDDTVLDRLNKRFNNSSQQKPDQPNEEQEEKTDKPKPDKASKTANKDGSSEEETGDAEDSGADSSENQEKSEPGNKGGNKKSGSQSLPNPGDKPADDKNSEEQMTPPEEKGADSDASDDTSENPNDNEKSKANPSGKNKKQSGKKTSGGKNGDNQDGDKSAGDAAAEGESSSADENSAGKRKGGEQKPAAKSDGGPSGKKSPLDAAEDAHADSQPAADEASDPEKMKEDKPAAKSETNRGEKQPPSEDDADSDAKPERGRNDDQGKNEKKSDASKPDADADEMPAEGENAQDSQPGDKENGDEEKSDAQDAGPKRPGEANKTKAGEKNDRSTESSDAAPDGGGEGSESDEMKSDKSDGAEGGSEGESSDKDSSGQQSSDKQSSSKKPGKPSSSSPKNQSGDSSNSEAGESSAGDSGSESEPGSESESSPSEQQGDKPGDQAQSQPKQPGKKKPSNESSPAQEKGSQKKEASQTSRGEASDKDAEEMASEEHPQGADPKSQGAKPKKQPGDQDAKSPDQPKKQPGKNDPKASQRGAKEGQPKDGEKKKEEKKKEDDESSETNAKPKVIKPEKEKKPQAEGEKTTAEEEMKGPGRKNGQKAKQPQKGEGGESAEDKQGTADSKTEGPGQNAKQSGQNKTEKGKEGQGKSQQPGQGAGKQPGDQKGEGEGQSGKEGQKGAKSDKGGQKSDQGSPSTEGKNQQGQESGGGGEGSEGKSESGSSSGDNPSGKPGSEGKGPASKPQNANGSSRGDARESGSAGPGGNAADAVADPEAANLEYNRQAAELVLQRLKDDLNQDQVDPELLKDLGWTEEQLQRYVERLAKQLEKPAGDLTPQEEARRRQFEETLKTLDLKTTGTKRSGEKSPQREVEQTGARRAPVPADYKAAHEAFTKRLAKQKPAAKK